MSEYGMKYPFLDESPSFCHGYECGIIGYRMQEREEVVWDEALPIHKENIEQIKLMAEYYGYDVMFLPTGYDEWTSMACVPLKGRQPKPMFVVVEGGKRG